MMTHLGVFYPRLGQNWFTSFSPDVNSWIFNWLVPRWKCKNIYFPMGEWEAELFLGIYFEWRTTVQLDALSGHGQCTHGRCSFFYWILLNRNRGYTFSATIVVFQPKATMYMVENGFWERNLLKWTYLSSPLQIVVDMLFTDCLRRIVLLERHTRMELMYWLKDAFFLHAWIHAALCLHRFW